MGGLHVLVLVVQHGDKAAGDTQRLARQPHKFAQHVVAAFVGAAQCFQRPRAAIAVAVNIHQHGFLRTGLVPVRNYKEKVDGNGPV